MKTYTLSNNAAAKANIKTTTKYLRIFINDELSKAIGYPIDEDQGEVFNADGKRYTSTAAFEADYGITIVEIDGQPTTIEQPSTNEQPTTIDCTFSTIIELKEKLRALNANEQTVVKVSLTVTIGKVRIEGTKQLLEEELKVEDAIIDELRSKWIFLTHNDAPLYVKEFSAATFTIA